MYFLSTNEVLAEAEEREITSDDGLKSDQLLRRIKVYMELLLSGPAAMDYIKPEILMFIRGKKLVSIS